AAKTAEGKSTDLGTVFPDNCLTIQRSGSLRNPCARPHIQGAFWPRETAELYRSTNCLKLFVRSRESRDQLNAAELRPVAAISGCFSDRSSAPAETPVPHRYNSS